jgi:hypothetical protein
MNFSFNIDEQDIRKKVDALLNERIATSMNGQIFTMFRQGYGDKDTGGFGHRFIESIILDELGKTDLEQKVRQMVRDRINEAAGNGVDYMLSHTSRRYAFLERDSSILALLEESVKTAPPDMQSKIKDTIKYLKSKSDK